MKKFVLLALLSSLSFSKTAEISFNLKTASNSNSGTVSTEMTKSVTSGTEKLAFVVTPKEYTMNNVEGMLLEIKVIENQKVVTAPKMFVELNKSSTISEKNYPGVPSGFELTVKPSLK